MKKILLSTAWVISTTIWAQNGALFNGDMESWSDLYITETLNDWTTTESERPGSGAFTKSADAQHLATSIRLETVKVGSDTIFGYAVMGGTGESGPEITMPYNTPVDSLVFWYKCNVLPNDSALVLVMRSNAGGPIIEEFYLKGSQSSWKRASFPLISFAQDSLLVGFASTDPFNATGVVGSWIMIDNVQMISNTATPPALLNYSFENYTARYDQTADGWFSFDYLLVGSGIETVTRTSDAAGGSYAAQLEAVVLNEDDTVQSILSAGPFDPFSGNISGIPYLAQPTAFSIDYKFTPAGTDEGTVLVELRSGGAVIESKIQNLPAAASYTNVNIPLNVTSVPDTLIIVVFSGNNPGSVLKVDNLQMLGGNVQVEAVPFTAQGLSVYPNPANDVLHVATTGYDTGRLSLYDAMGSLIMSTSIAGSVQHTLNLNELPSGIYFLEFRNEQTRLTRRIIRE